MKATRTLAGTIEQQSADPSAHLLAAVLAHPALTTVLREVDSAERRGLLSEPRMTVAYGPVTALNGLIATYPGCVVG
jgi:hypothetical protein